MEISDPQFHRGSNSVICNNGLSNLDVDKIVDYLMATHYRRNALGTIHFIHKRNPLGKLGVENSVDAIYHGWFAPGADWVSVKKTKFGPAPANLVGGINASYAAYTTWLPKNPIQKMYRDGGEGYPINSWEVTEPQDYYQGTYIRLLAEFENSSTDTVSSSAEMGSIGSSGLLLSNPQQLSLF